MPELVNFIDGFDHAPPGWDEHKYTTVQGAPGRTPGPYHGDAAEFAGGGQGYWPALVGQYGSVADNPWWKAGAWSANVRVSAEGWGGDLVLLQTAWHAASPGGEDFVHHELRLGSDGSLSVWVEPLTGFLPGTPADPADYEAVPGASSGPGAVPIGEWFTLEYRTKIDLAITSEGLPPAGYCHARVNEAEVFLADNVVTGARTWSVREARYFRFGNLREGNGVVVAVDDVCSRCDTAVAPIGPLPWWGTHRVATAFPAGPGLRAEHAVVGAASGWEACADLGGGYISRGAGGSPVDQYLVGPLPTFAPAEGAAAAVWALVESRDMGGDGMVTRRVVAADGTAVCARSTTSTLPHFLWQPCPTAGGAGVGQMFGLEVGWGNDVGLPDTTEEGYHGHHLAVELWYRPAAAPPVDVGGQRWAVSWVG